MNRTRIRALSAKLLILAAVAQSFDVFGCATCFGQSDSALARGMNMGIASLLVVLALVLSAITGFFIFLARQSARTAAAQAAPSGSPEPVTESAHD